MTSVPVHPNMSSMDEAALIEGCRNGNRGAQHELYKKYAEQLYRLALRITGNAQDASDITQEAFVQAFRSMRSFDGRASVGTWLYRIATNEALQLLRRRRTEARHLEQYAESQPSASDPAQAQPDQGVQDALAKLSEHHRIILVLKYQQGLKYDEIATVMEIAPGTVASRMNRARAEMKAILRNETPSREGTGREAHPISESSKPGGGSAG